MTISALYGVGKVDLIRDECGSGETLTPLHQCVSFPEAVIAAQINSLSKPI